MMGKSLRLNLDLSDFDCAERAPSRRSMFSVLIRSTNDNCCHTVAIKIGHGHGRAKQRPPLRQAALLMVSAMRPLRPSKTVIAPA